MTRLSNRLPHRLRATATSVVAMSLALALALPARAASTLEASLDHQILQPGEAARLRLRQQGDGPAVPPDLGPLARDFEVLGTSQSRQISIVNGVRESSTDWLVTIAPRATGTLTVPAITAGDAVSEPIALQVVAAKAEPAGTPKPDLFVESSVDQTSPFVQGEVHYTVKVYDGIGISEGTLTEPAADRLGVRPIGEGRTYDEMVGGRRYRVHERAYALFPQASGEIVVPPVTLEATVPDARGGRGGGFGRSSLLEQFFGGRGLPDPFGDDLFDRFFDRGRQVRVRSNAVTLSVQARPDAAGDGWFLPARHVELSQEWGAANPTFRVGEPIDRTVVLRALGASAEQLPELNVPAGNGVKQYADGSKARTLPTPDGTVAERRQTYSLLPTAAGPVTLPAIEVTWWDVDAKQTRTATLPAQTIDVLPAAGTSPAAPASPAPRSAGATAAPAAGAAASAATPAPGPTPASGIPTTWWLAGSGLLGLALLTGAWITVRRLRARAAHVTRPARPSARDLTRALEDACRRSDARAARAALLRWGGHVWGEAPPATTSEIARRIGHPGLAEALAALDMTLYGRDPMTWRGDALWREFRAATRTLHAARDAGAPEVLPALYPSTPGAPSATGRASTTGETSERAA